MDYVQIINVVCYVLCVILFAVMLFFKVRGNVVGAVSELIAMAEETDFAGSEKMAIVVAKLSQKVPAAFRGILSEERLQEIAQWIFDWMRKYALAYINSQTVEDSTDIEDANHAILEEMVNGLSSLGVDALREIASRIGVEIEGKSEDEIIKGIILSCLLKE